MIRPDMTEFRDLLDQCAVVFGGKWTDPAGKRLSKPDDATVEAYWVALKDLPLDAVRACINLHLKRGKYFPRPAELRPKSAEPREADPAGDAKFKAAVAFNRRNWEELLRENEPLARWLLLGAYLARTDLEDPSSVIYAERMQFCRGVAQRLVAQFGRSWCTHDSHCMHTASRLLGGEYIQHVEPAQTGTGAAA